MEQGYANMEVVSIYTVVKKSKAKQITLFTDSLIIVI
jgi:hypothetical protein